MSPDKSILDLQDGHPTTENYSAQNITIMRLKSLLYLDVKRAFLAGTVSATSMLGRALSGCAQFHFWICTGHLCKTPASPQDNLVHSDYVQIGAPEELALT